MSVSNVLREILARLSKSEINAASIEKFSLIVHEVGAEHGAVFPQQDERVAFARQLMDAQVVSRPEIRRRLMRHFGVSRPCAYRDIKAAFEAAPYSDLFSNESAIISLSLKGIPREFITQELIDVSRLRINITKFIKEAKR